jgi:hypothetical protein
MCLAAGRGYANASFSAPHMGGPAGPALRRRARPRRAQLVAREWRRRSELNL